MTTGKTSYHDVKSEVLSRIRGGVWKAGLPLPNEIDLAKEFGCARATVNRAMRELAEDGLLERRRKAGTFVKTAPTRQAKFTIPLIRQEIEDSGATYRYSLVTREIQKAPGWLQARLDLTEGKVLHLQCMHFADNQSFQFENRWINLAAVPTAADESFKVLGPNEWLVQTVPFTNAQLAFGAVNTPKHIAEFMSVPEGQALFNLERTTWLDRVPVTLAQLYFAPGYQMMTRV